MPKNQEDKNREDAWDKHQLLVLKTLDGLNKSMEKLTDELAAHRLDTLEKLTHLRIASAVNKIKASFYGSLGGAMAVFVDIFFKWYTSHK